MEQFHQSSPNLYVDATEEDYFQTFPGNNDDLSNSPNDYQSPFVEALGLNSFNCSPRKFLSVTFVKHTWL